MAADIDGSTINDCSVVTNVRVFSRLRFGVSLILVKDDQVKEKEKRKKTNKTKFKPIQNRQFIYSESRGVGNLDLTTLNMSLG